MTGDEALDTKRIQVILATFAAERDWDQFHSPKNLAMALAAESGELLEQFQWLSEAQSRALTAPHRTAVEHELADVLIYLVRLADKLDVDLCDAAERKMQINERNYPAGKVRGSAKKYTEYPD